MTPLLIALQTGNLHEKLHVELHMYSLQCHVHSLLHCSMCLHSWYTVRTCDAPTLFWYASDMFTQYCYGLSCPAVTCSMQLLRNTSHCCIQQKPGSETLQPGPSPGKCVVTHDV